jgi:hypothetical protein
MLDFPVNVRLEPNLNSRIIGRLKLHKKILIYVSSSTETRAEYNIFELDKNGKIRFVRYFIKEYEW